MADPDEVYEMMLPGVPYTASEVGAEFDQTREAASDALKILHASGRIARKDNTRGATTWWIPTPDGEGHRFLADIDRESEGNSNSRDPDQTAPVSSD